MTERRHIAVVGGGIAGLTFAACLGDRFACTVFEKRASFGEAGAAISLWPNALCVMDELGVLEQVLEVAGRITKAYLKTSSGAVLAESVPKSDYPLICMHRQDLHRVLLERAGARLVPDRAFESLRQRGDGRVEATFVGGETEVFDAVVGADGLRSKVREAILGDGEPVYRGYSCWRGVVKSDFEVGYSSETYGRGQRVGIVPIKNGSYGWWATCNEPATRGDEPEGRRAKLRRLFGGWHDPIPAFIEDTEVILKNSLFDRAPSARWYDGDVVLLGDAAHPMTPNLGQGGCAAIEGAYLLASAINAYGLGERAYARYVELHYPRAKMLVNESLKFGRVGQLENPLMTALRDASLRLAPASLAERIVSAYFSHRVTTLTV
jgi:2-polyprenyl-6-methoxyphenol hydroxylase-like FAD-dependent oxidoreductase